MILKSLFIPLPNAGWTQVFGQLSLVFVSRKLLDCCGSAWLTSGGGGGHRISTDHRTTPLPTGHITLCQHDTGNWKTEPAALFCTCKTSISSSSRIRLHLYSWRCGGQSSGWTSCYGRLVIRGSATSQALNCPYIPQCRPQANLNSAGRNSELRCLSKSVWFFSFPF